jgi:serine/threonine protein kinase
MKSYDNHNVWPDVQLGDFGMVIPLLPGYTSIDMGSFQGTPPYAAPEQLKGQFSLKTDIWGLRSVVHEMVHFIPPIQEEMKKTREQHQK